MSFNLILDLNNLVFVWFNIFMTWLFKFWFFKFPKTVKGVFNYLNELFQLSLG